MIKKILYIDMDGVVADFDAYIRSQNTTNLPHSEFADNHVCEFPQMFEAFKDSQKALELLNEYFDIYFLSTPMWDIPESYTSKRIWLQEHFPEICTKKLILTHRKDLVIGDFLVDDRIKNGVDKFTGKHIHFGTEKFPDWKAVVKYLLEFVETPLVSDCCGHPAGNFYDYGMCGDCKDHCGFEYEDEELIDFLK